MRAQSLDLIEDVTRQQHRGAGVGEFADRPLEGDLHQWVQARGRFIEHIQVHVERQRRDQCDLLPIALGVGAGLLAHVESELLDQAPAPFAVLRTVEASEQVEAFAAGESRPQRHITGDVGQASVNRDGLVAGVPAEDAELPAGEGDLPQQGPDGGGFPGAVRAEKAVDLALLHDEVGAVEGHDAAESFGELVASDDWVAHALLLRWSLGRSRWVVVFSGSASGGSWRISCRIVRRSRA